MKKQFFYAAFAIAMMASCTNEDNLVEVPSIPDAEDKVAIELGIDAPSVNATIGSRAVGSVGDVADEQGATELKNVWNGQQLYITMVKNNASGNEVATDDNGTAILNYDTYKYYAPRGGENVSNSGLIRMYAENNTPTGTGQGTLSYVYYPVAGQYDFYGYHVDDATNVDNSGVTNIKKITITGQQDIMGARTKEFNETNYGQTAGFTGTDFTEMIGWNFSARTARNGIKPILKFEHQLARLKFFVKAGSKKTAKKFYDINTASWKENKVSEDSDAPSTAMKVTSITAKNMIASIDMNLNGTKDGKPAIVTSPSENATADSEFSLFSFDNESNQMKNELDAVAPEYYVEGNETDNDNTNFEEDAKGTPVGESIMFFPHDDGTINTTQTVEFDIALSQLVQILDKEDSETYDETEWEEKTQTATLKVHASSIKNQTDNTVNAFEPGKSYNIYITIYGFERIEITAELTAWENGGDIDVDVEQEESIHKVAVTFNATDGTDDVVLEESDITISQHVEKCENENTVTATDGKYMVDSHSILHYIINKSGYEKVEGIVNAGNGKEVLITLTPTTASGGDDQNGGQ